MSERIKHSGPHTRFCVLCLSGEHERVDDEASKKARSRYFYPSGVTRMACPADNDGFPTCMGDTGYCGYSKELDSQVCIHLAAEDS